jgi:Domain of unknown function (DUF5710)
MSRQYLYVPFEDRDEVARLGALWDRATLRWYLTPRHHCADFKRWLGPAGRHPADAPRHPIASDRAFVAGATAPCQHCHTAIAVIGIFCEQGRYQNDALENFSVIHISGMDPGLEARLSPWPFFHRSGRLYRNHCPYCLLAQEDLYLHCEPNGVFFRMKEPARGRMTLTPLPGTVWLCGEETFEA